MGDHFDTTFRFSRKHIAVWPNAPHFIPNSFFFSILFTRSWRDYIFEWKTREQYSQFLISLWLIDWLHPGGGGTHIWKWRIRVPPSNSDVGVFRWQIASKKGVFEWQSAQNRGLSVKCIKSRGFQGQNGQKFLNISSKMSKFSKNRGSLGESW